MRRDIKSHINSCITCSKNLSSVTHHPQLHLEIPKVPFTCIAIDTIGKLPVTTSGNKYTLTCIDLLTSYVIAVPMPDKTTESMVEVYPSGILSRTGTCIVCLSDNRSEVKSNQMNTILKQLGIKHNFSNPYIPQGNSCIENMHNFLKRTLTKFLCSSDAEQDRILPFTCYCFNTTPTADDLVSPFFLIHRRDPLEGCTRLLTPGSIRYLGFDKGLILFAKLCKLWSAHANSLHKNRLLKTKKVERNKISNHMILKWVN